MPSYVFGYGSLLERASRTRTNPDAVGAWPARVTGRIYPRRPFIYAPSASAIDKAKEGNVLRYVQLHDLK